jgi:peptide-methionine (S)-S-oxide reductase
MQDLEQITFGGGCFWCLEPLFLMLKGISSVTSGYAGGHMEDPTYEDLVHSNTGHAEVVQIEFNPKEIKLEQLLEVFWSVHDPTTLNRQGNDIGEQYRSIILYKNEDQKKIAELSKTNAQSNFTDPIVTQLVPLDKFYTAEEYHQRFYEKNPKQPYCDFNIPPKISKVKESFPELIV